MTTTAPPPLHPPAAGAPSWPDVQARVAAIAAEWRGERAERQQRRSLDPADFVRLRDAGLLLSIVPADRGGLWRNSAEFVEQTCRALRTLAAGDPSVALVSSMHPVCAGVYLAENPASELWNRQREAVFRSALDGRQWGTITSEPGSGGDTTKTKAIARRDASAASPLPGDVYRISGDKHFGSGSGICDFMVTTAVPEGEDAPASFVIDTRGRPWDGSAGMTLVREWDGVGMPATQSHAMRLDDCPAVRSSWDVSLGEVGLHAGLFGLNCFTAVVLGVIDEAVATARSILAAKADAMRPYEKVEWTQAEMEHWLAVQAFESAVRTTQTSDVEHGRYATQRAKQSVAQLGESVLGRLVRVIGGSAFSRRSPFAAWHEDVRALGFLRPPWGLSFDNLFATSFEVFPR